MKTVCEDRGERIDENDPPRVDVHECKSRTATQRAVTLAEELLRAMGWLPRSSADWEDAVDAAVAWVNDHGTVTEAEIHYFQAARTPRTATSTDAVLPIVAQRSHISYWDFDEN